MSIASKEARETKYWIDLLAKTEYLNIEEIIKLLTSIVKSSRLINE